MATCSVCGDVKDHLLHTCNHCGKKNCPEHQLPENHVCIPKKADLSDGVNTSEKWFSEKHDRQNVMADKRRGERNMVDDSDSHLDETEPKRPLDDDEIDADTESSPHDWVSDVTDNREALKDRTTDRRDKTDSQNCSNTSSFPQDEKYERQITRERLNRRLSGDNSSSNYDPSASTPHSPQNSSKSTDATADFLKRVSSKLWIVIFLALVISASIAIVRI